MGRGPEGAVAVWHSVHSIAAAAAAGGQPPAPLPRPAAPHLLPTEPAHYLTLQEDGEPLIQPAGQAGGRLGELGAPQGPQGADAASLAASGCTCALLYAQSQSL